MAVCLGWFGVRGAGAPRIIGALRSIYATANREDIPETFRLFEQTAWTLILLEGSGSQYATPAHSAPTWAQALSLRLNVPSVSFFLLEGGWSYAVFDNGNEVVAQESYTLPVPEVYGDRARGGEVLGIDPVLFGQYEQALKEGREEPFPGDEFAPIDEWGHTDFARRIGLVYPDDTSRGTPYSPTESEMQRASTEWRGLPPRLDVPEPPHAAGKEIDFDNFPSGDDPF